MSRVPVPVTVFANGLHVLYSQPPFLADKELLLAVRRALGLGGPDAVQQDEALVQRITAGVQYPIEYVQIVDKTNVRWPATNSEITRGH